MSDDPTTNQVADNPELAVLTVLHLTISMSVRALEASHPELNNWEIRGEVTKSGLLAGHLVVLLIHLQMILSRYRAAVTQ